MDHPVVIIKKNRFFFLKYYMLLNDTKHLHIHISYELLFRKYKSYSVCFMRRSIQQCKFQWHFIDCHICFERFPCYGLNRSFWSKFYEGKLSKQKSPTKVLQCGTQKLCHINSILFYFLYIVINVWLIFFLFKDDF